MGLRRVDGFKKGRCTLPLLMLAVFEKLIRTRLCYFASGSTWKSQLIRDMCGLVKCKIVGSQGDLFELSLF